MAKRKKKIDEKQPKTPEIIDQTPKAEETPIVIDKPKKMTESDGIAAAILKLESNAIPVSSKMRIVSILAKAAGKDRVELLSLYEQAKSRLSPVMHKARFDEIESEIAFLKSNEI